MSRYIAIEGCKKCPHRHYYSAGAYECLKYGTVLPASHILDIPEWCPLPKLPTPASAPETGESPKAEQQRNSEWDRQREQIAASTWRCTVCNNVNPDDAAYCRQCDFSRMITRKGRLVPRDGQR